MYLLVGNATATALSSPARNYVIWLARLGSHGYTGQNPAELAEIKSYYIIMRETLAHKSTYDHLIKIETVDKIINANASKAPQKATN